MKKFLLLSLLLFLAPYARGVGGACPTSANMDGSNVTLHADGVVYAAPVHCYYVDFSGGSDASNGTTEGTAFKHSPGMNGATGTAASTTLVAGDGVILKGGVTWDFTIWPWSLTSGSGSADATLGCTGATCVYYGVDHSWFTGGSWTRPILSGGDWSDPGTNTVCNRNMDDPSGPHMMQNGNLVIIDNLEFIGLCIQSPTTPPGGNNPRYIDNGGRSGQTIENSYFHRVAWPLSSASSGHDFIMINGGSYHATYSVYDCTDCGPTTSYSSGGQGKYSGNGIGGGNAIYDHSVFFNLGDATDIGMVLGHDNYFFNASAFTGSGTFHSHISNDSSCTANSTIAFYNNFIDTSFSGQELGFTDNAACTFYDFNNVSTNQFTAFFAFASGQFGNHHNIFNNTLETMEDGTGISHATMKGGGATVQYQIWNLHIINADACTGFNIGTNGGGGGAFGTAGSWTTSFGTTLNANFTAYPGCPVADIVTQTKAQAAAQGYTYTQANQFSPTSSTVSTFRTGVNKTAFCTAIGASNMATASAVSAACQRDTTLGVTYNQTSHTAVTSTRVTNLRPTSGAWDVGAYFLPSGAGSPAISFSPTSLIFGSQNVGTTSATQSVTVTNTGTANLVITGSVTTTGANASEFAISGSTCTGATLIPSGTCTFNTSFSPAAAGLRSASWTVTDNASGSPHTGPLSGTGTGLPIVSFSPTSLGFGGQILGSVSSPMTVLMRNIGTSNLTILTTPTLAGANPGDFFITVGSSTCVAGATVTPGNSCTIVVTFAPLILGLRTASWRVTDNAAGSPHTGTIQGTGGQSLATIDCPAPGCVFTGSGKITMSGNSAPPTVTIAPTSASIPVNQTQQFTATVTGDPFNLGVFWTLTGSNCSGVTCGSLSTTQSQSGVPITYTAPPSSPGSVVLKATSALDGLTSNSVVPVITQTTNTPGVNNIFTPQAQSTVSTNTFNFAPTPGTTGTTLAVIVGTLSTANTITTVKACKPNFPQTCVTLTQAAAASAPPIVQSFQYRGINIGSGFTSVVIANGNPQSIEQVAVYDLSGIGSFDNATVLNNGPSTNTFVGPSITTARPGELVVCSIEASGGVSSVAPPFTFQQAAPTQFVSTDMGTSYYLNPTASTVTPTYSSSVNSAWAGTCGAYIIGVTPPSIVVQVTPTNPSVQTSRTQAFTATVTNDSGNAGVSWTVTCTGTCGTMASGTSASGVANVYTAPASIPSGASASLVQRPKGEIGNGGSLAVASTMLGDAGCAFAGWNTAAGALGVTDNKGETYPAAILSGTAAGGSAAIACLANMVAGVTSVTFTVSGSAPTALEVFFREYAGAATSNLVDQKILASTGSSPMDSGFMPATTNATDILIGFARNGAAGSFTVGNDGQGDNYGNLDQQTFLGSAVEDFFTTTATNTYKATMIPNLASGSLMLAAALKATSGGGGSNNVTVTATSITDPTKSASAVVTITASAIVGVTVSPTSASVTAGGSSIPITPTIVNDTNVNWTLSGLGTIAPANTANGVPVVYTPPGSVTVATSATVTATSVADPTKSASATIVINPVVGPASCNGSCPAFAGGGIGGSTAQGSGAASVGGRGGVVMYVKNTNDTGADSLRNCVQATGPRICVFRVAGIITQQTDLTVNNPFLTIAGQTAPGEVILGGPNAAGVTLRISTHDVTVRYLTLSPDNATRPTGPSTGTVGLLYANAVVTPVIADHITSRWTGNKFWVVTENFGQCLGDHVLQYSLLYEPHEAHPVGPSTSSNDDATTSACMKNADFHHNVLVNIDHRIPEYNNFSLRWINNITYNWSGYALQGLGGTKTDVIGNRWDYNNLVPGSTQSGPHPIHASNIIGSDWPGSIPGKPSFYVAGNIGPGHTTPNTDQYGDLARAVDGEPGNELGPFTAAAIRGTPLPASNAFPITVDPATNLDALLLPVVGNAFHLDCNGNWVSHRDAADKRVINEYQTHGTGGFWPNGVTYTGVIYCPPATSGCSAPPGQSAPFAIPTVQPNWQDAAITGFAVCTTTIQDGIPDAWRTRYGINTDKNHADPVSGFTIIEDFLNGLPPNQ